MTNLHTLQSKDIKQDQTEDPLLRKLLQLQNTISIFPISADRKPLTIIIGVSGGADSICLLHLLQKLTPHWQLDIHIAHLDHNLRPTSQRDAQFVAQIAKAWHLPIHIHTLPENALHSHPGGLEDGARHARYDFFNKVASQMTPADQTPIVAVAHHADDQAETVIINLIRGSGLRGLSGMKIISPLPQANQTAHTILIRPLLHTSKTEIQAYLHRHNLSWCEDESNTDPTFLRNHLRHQIMPQLQQINPNLSTTVGRTAQLLADDMARIAMLDHHNLHKVLIEPAKDQTKDQIQTNSLIRIVLNLDQLISFDPSSQRGIIRQALSHLTIDPRKINFMLIESLLQMLNSQNHATGPHPLAGSIAWSIAGATAETFRPIHPHLNHHSSGYLLEKITLDLTSLKINQPTAYHILNEWILWVTLLPAHQLPKNWRTKNQPWRAFLDVDAIDTLHLCTPQPGNRFAPLGLHGHQKSLGDLFTNHKISTALRTGWPLIVESKNHTILWVCGLRTAHNARITEQTQTVCSLYWEQKQESNI